MLRSTGHPKVNSRLCEKMHAGMTNQGPALLVCPDETQSRLCPIREEHVQLLHPRVYRHGHNVFAEDDARQCCRAEVIQANMNLDA